MRKLLFLTLPIIALQIRINIITSIIINEVPFSQNLTCLDCVPPVTYDASSLPDFASIDGNELKVQGQPDPGQYHLSIEMTDGTNKKAHLLLILVLLDQKGTNDSLPKASTNNLVLSMENNPSQNNLTSQMLHSPAVLNNEEKRTQMILDKQAELNRKIANLLILIRRYQNSHSQNKKKVVNVTNEMENLILRQSALTQEVLLSENQLGKDKEAIKQLLEFIRKSRSEIVNKKQEEIQNEDLVDRLTEMLREKFIEKENEEVSIELRQQFIENLTQRLNNVQMCNISEINDKNDEITEYQNRQNQLKKNITQTDDSLLQQRKKIQDLKKQLVQAEQQEKNLVESRNNTERQLYAVELSKGKALSVLQTLQNACTDDNETKNIEQDIKKLQDLLADSHDKLNDINSDISDILRKITEATITLNILNYDIDFLNRQIDQSILDLQKLYDDVEIIQKKLKQITTQRNKFLNVIEDLDEELQSITHLTDNTNVALENAKNQLAKLLVEKRKIDEDVRQIMLNNLDIIKSVRGKGDFKFDFTQLVNLTSSFIDFEISKVYEIKIGQGIEECLHSVIYYGMGVIEKVDKPIITIKGSNNQTLDLKHAECSLSMSTVEGYQPKQGDVICWKGYQEDGKWVVLESIIFPAKQE